MDDNTLHLCLDSIASEVAAQGLTIEKIKVSPEVYRRHEQLRHAIKINLEVNNQLQGYLVQVVIPSDMPIFLDRLLGEVPTLDLLQVVETYEIHSRFERDWLTLNCADD